MLELVKVICVTNLDGYTMDSWPSHLYRPKVGDRVQSNLNHYLKIVSITHCRQNMTPPSNDTALLKIELHN